MGDVLAVAAGGSHSLALLQVRPRLAAVAQGGGSIRLSWSRGAPDWVVQTRTTLAATNWLPFTGLPVDDGTNLSVTISPLQGRQFFRLHSP